MNSEELEIPTWALRFGIQPIINARGSVTRLGGARMSPGVIEAIRASSEWTVSIESLHAAACRFLAPRCGTEAALVTCGASASLMLGTAAILARWDLGRMERLPDTNGYPNELLVARSHRNGYDHAVRAAGARLIEVGFDEVASGAGVRTIEAWEFEVALSEQTAGILYVLDKHSHPPLAEVVRVAHAHHLPVLVDAAAELPPVANLHRIAESGADLIAFSGGKALGGPQSTGILCGRRDLVGSAFLQMMDLDEHAEHWTPPIELVDRSKLLGVPRQGIGRMLKVAKENIIGLLQAIDEFSESNQQDLLQERLGWLEEMKTRFAAKGILSKIVNQDKPRLELSIPGSDAVEKAFELCKRLQQGTPPIFLGHGQLHHGVLVIDPACLTKAQIPTFIARLLDSL